VKAAATFIVMLAALAFAGAALAHAFLDRAVPAVGSKVHGSPAEVRIVLSQTIEPMFSNLRVFDRSGKQVDRGDKQLDNEDKAVLKVSLPSLPPGVYRVVWRVLSTDTHVTEGDFTFEVIP
jgi:methionine-rich copper-binding protein CopC